MIPTRRDLSLPIIKDEVYYHCHESRWDRHESFFCAAFGEQGEKCNSRRQAAQCDAVGRKQFADKAAVFVQRFSRGSQGRGIGPTPRAIELYPLVESAIAQLQSALNQRSGADPTQVRRCFTLACSDVSQVHDVCKIVEVLSHRMPRAGLRIVSMDYVVASNGMESGEVDAVMAPRQATRGLCWAELYREKGILIVRRNHPRVSKRISRELFNSLDHIDVMITSGYSGHTRKLYEAFLKRSGLTPHVMLTVPAFTAAALAVARTDYAACVPQRVAEALSEYLPLKIVELPFHGFNVDIALIWHFRTDSDPAARHFREAIIAALGNNLGKPKRIQKAKAPGA